MRISFIVPVYKTEEYLEDCLKSIKDQDYEDIEIICVMDGKSKKAEKIIKKFDDVKSYTIEHGGAPKARNYGFEKSTGDYVSFFDSDCYLEPGVVSRWMRMFDVKDVDFVYSGYKFKDGGAIPGKPFNPYLLRVNNYIATMFPMKREVFPGFDEELKSLQDWDLWLTVVENGGEGIFLGGYDFTTETPDENSISGKGCTDENWLDRLNTVKQKHDITKKDTCITSIVHENDAIRIAKSIGADFRVKPSFKPNNYNLIYLIGFYPQDAKNHIDAVVPRNEETQVVIHWVGTDIMWMDKVQFGLVKHLVKAFRQAKIKHVCENVWAKSKLLEMGISKNNIDMSQLPIEGEKMEKFPKKPKVLLEADFEYRQYVEAIKKALPDIEIEQNEEVNIKDYKVLLKLTSVNVVDDNIKKFFANGRYVVSNIQGLYTNYFDVQNEEERKKLIEKVRKLAKRKKRNIKARKFYLNNLNPDDFKKELGKYKDAKSKFRNTNV